MQSKLASKDLELAKTQQNLALLQNEVVELRRFSKRDGINMDYLKNIVIQVHNACFELYLCGFNLLFPNYWRQQYMTFPAQSSEKLSLVPVLAMLLQFTPKELSSVQRCAVLEPVQSSIWSSMGLGGSSSATSSKVAKEVKRPVLPIPAATPTNIPSTTIPSNNSAPAASVHKMSSSSLTAASLAQNSARLAAPSNNITPSSNNSILDASHSTTGVASANGKSKITLSTPVESFPQSPLSPSTSNSDVEGTYSPPSLHMYQPPTHPTTNAVSSGNTPHRTSPVPSSLMIESNEHDDEEHTLHTTSDTPGKRPHRLGSGFKKATTPAKNSAHSMHRMTVNRSASMNSEYEFQQKLKSIGSDILSVSYDVTSYDDQEMGATYVDVEDGILEEEGEDDQGDSTSV